MPPRKRAASAPKPEDALAPEATDENQLPADGNQEPAAGDGDTGGTPPERSDLQAEAPCAECFPGGWAAQATVVGALGCEHGTWQREPVN